ncbi:MAG: hypothetical protein WBL68_01465 [Nitrososphaeraceae archaeon]|jgi:hypothetical protein
MNTKYIAFMALVTGTLVGTVAIATDSAFATENNQVISQDCGSELESLNTGCQNTASQIEGDEHAVSLASQQTFEEEEEENTPAPPGQQSITPSIVLPH